MHGLTVVELGSGTGLVGVVAGLMQAENVWITDQEFVLLSAGLALPTLYHSLLRSLIDLMQTNVSLNRLESNVNVSRLDWSVKFCSLPAEPIS